MLSEGCPRWESGLPHAMSGTELSRARTELRLLPPEAYQQKSDRVERGPTLPFALNLVNGPLTVLPVVKTVLQSLAFPA
jgi:hypothetical protein